MIIFWFRLRPLADGKEWAKGFSRCHLFTISITIKEGRMMLYHHMSHPVAWPYALSRLHLLISYPPTNLNNFWAWCWYTMRNSVHYLHYGIIILYVHFSVCATCMNKITCRIYNSTSLLRHINYTHILHEYGVLGFCFRHVLTWVLATTTYHYAQKLHPCTHATHTTS